MCHQGRSPHSSILTRHVGSALARGLLIGSIPFIGVQEFQTWIAYPWQELRPKYKSASLFTNLLPEPFREDVAIRPSLQLSSHGCEFGEEKWALREKWFVHSSKLLTCKSRHPQTSQQGKVNQPMKCLSIYCASIYPVVMFLKLYKRQQTVAAQLYDAFYTLTWTSTAKRQWQLQNDAFSGTGQIQQISQIQLRRSTSLPSRRSQIGTHGVLQSWKDACLSVLQYEAWAK